MDAGLGNAVGTARAARDRGYSPGQVLELIDEFTRRRGEFSSEGALAWRIENSPPTRPVAEGWPGKSSTKSPEDEERRLRERLDRRFGVELTCLSREALRSLADEAGFPPDIEIDRSVPSVRVRLLRQMARNASEAA